MIKRIGIKVALILLFFLLLTILPIYHIATTQLLEDEKIIFIGKNNSTHEVGKMLFDNEILEHPKIFDIAVVIYCKIYDKKIKAGEYAIVAHSNLIDIIKTITSGRQIQHKLMIPQGFTVKQVLKKITTLDNIKHSVNSKNDIIEGSLLPETYFYVKNTKDTVLIDRIQEAMNKVITIEWKRRDKKIDNIIKSPKEAIILASIVEKETYIESEKPIIAGVYLNRLRKKMRLQADPTVMYGLEMLDDSDWSGKKTLHSHLWVDSEYNTYRRGGLPPTPICNPGKRTILAVLHPQWSEHLFFVAQTSGEHLFATHFDIHKKNIKKARK